ncbi:MAG: LacI family DNA-binding transcriptional regulator [Chloroflexota bacterium]|nr:LacI family DNA-binding transcriptional regulator [Chloroflexota bacterium]
MTTIRDIARRANVSIATVSRVLNNNATVNESIRYTVLKAAEELAYPVQNLRLKPQISPAVLVLTSVETTLSAAQGASMREFERRVWDAVHTVLETRGIAARLPQSSASSEDARQYAEDVSINGLILLGGIIQREFVEELIRRQLPFVVAGSRLDGLMINAVMVDVAQGIREAAAYLIAQGRRRIALVNGPATTMTSAEKLDGLRLTLARHDLPFDPDSVIVADFHPDSGYVQTRHLLESRPDTDAILYADDSIALGGLRALREQGRRVPDDVAVVGFGDYELAHYTDPMLSSVQFDMALMGRMAARRLSMLLDEPDSDPWLMRVPCWFIARQST